MPASPVACCSEPAVLGVPADDSLGLVTGWPATPPQQLAPGLTYNEPAAQLLLRKLPCYCARYIEVKHE